MNAPPTGATPRKDEGHTAVRPATPEEHTHTNYSNQDQRHVAEGAFSSRRRFLIWACMAGFVGPERVVERILVELADEGSTP
jgi:hypothetical protein